jgi:hypothetical protein
MTQMGHSLVGLSFGILALKKHPLPSNRTSIPGILFLFVILANLPDLPVPGWGHDRYEVSHSLWVTMIAALGISCAYLLLCKYILRIKPHRIFLFLMNLALFSHLLLDSFYNHGYGVAIFWPFSSASLALPIPWLSVQKDLPPPITQEMIKIWFFEFLTFGPLLLIALIKPFIKARLRFLSLTQRE